jgi:hypothetical protein
VVDKSRIIIGKFGKKWRGEEEERSKGLLTPLKPPPFRPKTFWDKFSS